MPKGGCSRTPQQEECPLSNDMVEKQTGRKVGLCPRLQCVWGCLLLGPTHCVCLCVVLTVRPPWAVHFQYRK